MSKKTNKIKTIGDFFSVNASASSNDKNERNEIIGSVLSEQNPTKAAKWFLDEKTRRNRNVTVANESSKRQRYFKGVFPEANGCADFESDDNVDTENDATAFNF